MNTPADKTPGYPEPKPRSREDAQKPHPGQSRDREEGGLARDPDADGSAQG